MRGELQPASESLQRCIEIAPSTASCHAHLGHTLVQMNRAEEGLGMELTVTENFLPNPAIRGATAFTFRSNRAEE